jgi:hypothetical protein
MKEEMMNDNDLFDVIKKASYLADRHVCVPWCGESGLYAGGEPPAGYWWRAVTLAASLGYRMQHDIHPVELDGDGCQGHAVGYLPPCPDCGTLHGEEPRHICIIPGMPPANDLFVAVHELTHALLRHPAQSRSDLIDKAMRRGDRREDDGQEITCHLSGIAVCTTFGVPVREGAFCYLADRVRAGRKPVQEKDEYAAFMAARVITEAMR